MWRYEEYWVTWISYVINVLVLVTVQFYCPVLIPPVELFWHFRMLCKRYHWKRPHDKGIATFNLNSRTRNIRKWCSAATECDQSQCGGGVKKREDFRGKQIHRKTIQEETHIYKAFREAECVSLIRRSYTSNPKSPKWAQYGTFKWLNPEHLLDHKSLCAFFPHHLH